MANVEAFEAGFNMGGKKKKSKGGKSSDNASGKGSGGSDSSLGEKSGKNDMNAAMPKSYAKGGKVRKTGMAKVHKGELVLTAAEAKACKGKMGKGKGKARKRVSKRS
jgi:hypothetical protein